MSLSTTITLNKLSEALIQQYKNLCEETFGNDGVIKEKSQEYEISELSVRVTVIMKRIQTKTPTGVQFCGGKLSENTAKVIVNPDNEKVAEVVSAHFKSQVVPPVFSAPQMSVFDEVTLNNHKKII